MTSATPVARDPHEAVEADVAVVGYGPVGQVLANLLAARGRRVVVLERWSEPYPMPRAVGFDSEGARILAAAGVGDVIAAVAEPSGDYDWRTAAGDSLLHIVGAERGHCHWPDASSMYQPGLEAALAAHGARLPTLLVRRGHEAVDLDEHGDGDGARVTVHAAGPGGRRLAVTAAWVVGCDGANSFVRDRLGTTTTDLGFSHDWLICDVVPKEPTEFRPNNLQVCDPARPRTAVSAGPGHRRWEFMRLPGETVEDLDTRASAWRLLDLFGVTEENAVLERHAVYTFRSSWADRWRRGRLLLAGDAAHLMPPFAGQGMCSGFRDAANLAWKLDLVLGGAAGEALLDTYEAERREHVQHAVRMSVDLGRVLCLTDPRAAADRDEVMLAARQRGVGAARPRLAVRPLADGLLHRDADGRPGLLAGHLTPLGPVRRGPAEGLFDDVVGRGWALWASEDPLRLLDTGGRAALRRLGAQPVHLVPPGSDDTTAVVDVDGVHLDWLAAAGAVAVLVRPDFYAFGAARDPEALRALVADLDLHPKLRHGWSP